MAVILLTGTLFAQTPYVVKQVKPTGPALQLMNTRTADTITIYLDRASSFVIYGYQGGGYVFGNNVDFTESAMQYDAIANASLTDVIFWVAAKEIVGTPDNLVVNAYSDASGNPGTVIGTTTIGMDVIDTTAATSGFNTIHFSTPVDLGGAMFYVGANLATDDTIGFVSSNPDSLDGNGEKRAKLNYNGTWMAYDDAFGGFDCDAMYIPIVDISTGANYMESKGLKVMRVYPNPAKDFATINYSIDKTQNVKVRVFDVTGKVILQQEETQVAGNQQVKVNLTNLPAGNYYYTIPTESTRLTSKIVHVK